MHTSGAPAVIEIQAPLPNSGVVLQGKAKATEAPNAGNVLLSDDLNRSLMAAFGIA